MNKIVLFDSLDLSKAKHDDFYTTTEIIARCSGNGYKEISNLVRKYRKELEEIAPLRFSILKSLNPKGGRPTKVYHLNEQQTLFFIPLLGNTPAVVQFKFDLAAAFVAMRNELQVRQIARVAEKPLKRELNEAIDCWQNAPKFAYQNINKLLIKTATGQSIKQVKARDPEQVTMLNLLTSTEQATYFDLENVAIGLIMAQVEYSFIKDTLEKIATKKALTATNEKG